MFCKEDTIASSNDKYDIILFIISSGIIILYNELNILNIFSKTLYNKLINGNSLEIRGFGRWYSKKLKENFNARNPSTNELIYKPERVKIRFKPSKKLNKIINE